MTTARLAVCSLTRRSALGGSSLTSAPIKPPLLAGEHRLPHADAANGNQGFWGHASCPLASRILWRGVVLLAHPHERCTGCTVAQKRPSEHYKGKETPVLILSSASGALLILARSSLSFPMRAPRVGTQTPCTFAAGWVRCR